MATPHSGISQPDITTDHHTKPEPYNPDLCLQYFHSLKVVPPDLQRDPPGKHASELGKYEDVLRALCASSTFSPPDREPRVLDGWFLREILESNEFDAPFYDKITIKNVRIKDSIDLSRIHIYNNLELNIIFDDIVDFSYSSTEHNIDFRGSVFVKGICLKGFSSRQSIFFGQENSGRERQVNLTGFEESRVCNEDGKGPDPGSGEGENFINLNYARVDGNVEIDGPHRDQKRLEQSWIGLSAVDASIGQALVVRYSKLYNFDLRNLTVGNLEIPGDKLEHATAASTDTDCTAYFDGMHVHGRAVLQSSVYSCALSATGADIGGDFDFSGTSLVSLDFTGSHAGGNLVGWGGTWSGSTDKASSAGVALKLDHADVNLLQISPSTWPNYKRWKQKEQLPASTNPERCIAPAANSPNLANMVPIAWDYLYTWLFGYHDKLARPATESIVSVNDFHFKSFALPYYCMPNDLRDSFVTEGNQLSETTIERWLVSAQYSPAEFAIVEKLFRDRGQEAAAKRIGFVGRALDNRRDYDRWSTMPRWIVGTLLRWSIGYGYCLYAALVVALFWVVIGRFILSNDKTKVIFLNKENHRFNIAGSPVDERGDAINEGRSDPSGNAAVREGSATIPPISPWVYSFDMLLPLIKFRESNYDVEIITWHRVYFYFHKVIGFLLGGFLLAGISGLVK